jgi:hypothetical protein
VFSYWYYLLPAIAIVVAVVGFFVLGRNKRGTRPPQDTPPSTESMGKPNRREGD